MRPKSTAGATDDGEQPMETWRGQVPGKLAGQRLDQVLAELVPELSRTQAKRLIDDGFCVLDGHRAKSGTRPAPGAAIVVRLVEPESDIVPEDIPLEVLLEDDSLIVVNKPAGIAAHPARGTPRGTLLNALAGHLHGRGGPQPRVTLVHRLDRDTSGAILAAKTVAVHRELKTQMDDGTLSRVYWALVRGLPEPRRDTISQPLGRERGDKLRMVVSSQGVEAVTHYEVLATDGDLSLVRAKLQTGRTHQIRVHFEWLGHPLVGERTYRGSRPRLDQLDEAFVGQALHSRSLSFDHPVTGQRLTVEAALPAAMASLVARLTVPDLPTEPRTDGERPGPAPG